MLTSPVVVSGRVLRQGLAIGAARVRFVPDRVVFAESADPAAHVGTEVATDPAGRFQLPLPPDPRGVVQVYALDGSAGRVPVRAAPGTGEVSLGDIQLPERRAATIRLMDPRSCDLSAVGPVGQLGLAVVRAARISAAIFQLLVPEAGTWLLEVQCGDRSYRAVPGAIVVPAAGADPLVDLRLEESEPFRR